MTSLMRRRFPPTNWLCFKPLQTTRLRIGLSNTSEPSTIQYLTQPHSLPTCQKGSWCVISLTIPHSYKTSGNGLNTKCTQKNGWRITHTQYVGKNFFLIKFDEEGDRDEALAYAPWFFGQKFSYTFPWEPNFDVTTSHYRMLPVWVEFPFHSLALEGAKYKLANNLGEVLLYVKGNEKSSYPNNKACILWDLREQIP